MFLLQAVCISLLLTAIPVFGYVSRSRLPVINSSEIQYQVLICQLETSPMCGGVVVGREIILTSASCILQFRSTRSFLEEAVLYGGGTRLLFEIGNVSDVVIHPQYTDNPENYDLALIKFIPEDKGPYLKPTVIKRTWKDGASTFCLMTSWWSTPDSWPEQLMWQAVSPLHCSPQDPNLICFNTERVELNKKDNGSPIVCDNELVGLVPEGERNRAINLTSNYEWLSNTISTLNLNSTSNATKQDEDSKFVLINILQKLDVLTQNYSLPGGTFKDHFTTWNDQIVIPLNIVLLTITIFFFVVLFLVLFIIVIISCCRK